MILDADEWRKNGNAIDSSRLTQGYFTYTTAAGIMVTQHPTVPSAGCCQTFLGSQHELNLTIQRPHLCEGKCDRICVRLLGHCC